MTISLEPLIAIQELVMAQTPITIKRYLYHQINWKAQAICLMGNRGVGKTTLMSQYWLEKYKSATKALYISADNVYVLGSGLFAIAQEFFQFGGDALFIDEIHKYPNWAQELKNILDTYRNKQIIFSASSALELKKSKYDLSRRAVYYELKGLSFREYLNFAERIEAPMISLPELFSQHIAMAEKFKGKPILKYFRNYLMNGYFPFFLESIEDYTSKVNNIVEKVLFEDIAVIYNLRQTTIPILKKLLWLVATSKSLTPNVDRISKDLKVSREIIYNCLEHLAQSGLLNNVYPDAQGLKLVRKPGKIYLENTNLICAINGILKLTGDIGNFRETFFVNQTIHTHRLSLHDHADFILNDQFILEVGGKSKNFRQIKGEENSYLVIDDIEIGFGRKIPLYLFGFLY